MKTSSHPRRRLWLRLASALLWGMGCLPAVLLGQEGAPSLARPENTTTVFEAIRMLESISDPKCHATASRLQNMICGTPLEESAQFKKNALCRALAGRVWREATLVGEANTSRSLVDREAIALVLQDRYPKIRKTAAGWSVGAPGKDGLMVEARDKRQFSSIAYSLRAILGAEQESWIDAQADLPPLSDDAVAALKEAIDVYQLALLKLVDDRARKANQKMISESAIVSAWRDLGLPLEPARGTEVPAENGGDAVDSFATFKKIIADKVAAYAVYNEVSNQIFLRNLQVYFARRRWPAKSEDGAALKQYITQAIVNFAVELYLGADGLARGRGDRLVREQDVSQFAQQFVAHRINAYEDAIFFPRLESSRQVVLEAYDMDSFRDSGLHWRYLEFALEDPSFTAKLGADPFAAELLAENVAQFGVLMLRVAGQQAIEQGDERLATKHIEAGLRDLQARIVAHQQAKPRQETPEAIASTPEATARGPAEETWFSEMAAAWGIDYSHRSSDWLNRQMRSYLKTGRETGVITIPPAFGGSGIAAEDVNHDGWPDLFVLSGLGNRFYLNDQGKRFIDATAVSGIGWVREVDGRPGEVRQPIVADFDNDGHQDLLITYVADNHRLYKGRGDGTFEDVTARCGLGGAGLIGGPATAFDYDRDGRLDLFVAYFGDYLGGVLPTLARRNTNGLPDKLFRNLGDMRFEEVKNTGVEDVGWGQAAGHTDFNGDGWQDLIVGNDFGVNGYYLNLGNGMFQEVSAKLNTNKPSYTMGIGIADLNRDRLPDIYISNIVTMNKDQKYVLPNEDTPQTFDPNKLANMQVVEANDLFLSRSQGTEPGALPVFENSKLIDRGYSSTGWAWDADFFDFDNDGDDDLYVLNGMNEYNLYSSENPYYTDPLQDENFEVEIAQANADKNVFFVNEGGRLQDRSLASGLDFVSNARSAAYFDFDGDGFLDVVVNNYHGPVMLFRNRGFGDKHRWLEIRLEGDAVRGVNRDAIGARIEVLPAGKEVEDRLWREVHSTIGYLSVHPKAQRFGVGAASKVTVLVTWPDGSEQQFENVDSNQRYHLKQGERLQASPTR